MPPTTGRSRASKNHGRPQAHRSAWHVQPLTHRMPSQPDQTRQEQAQNGTEAKKALEDDPARWTAGSGCAIVPYFRFGHKAGHHRLRHAKSCDQDEKDRIDGLHDSKLSWQERPAQKDVKSIVHDVGERVYTKEKGCLPGCRRDKPPGTKNAALERCHDGCWLS